MYPSETPEVPQGRTPWLDPFVAAQKSRGAKPPRCIDASTRRRPDRSLIADLSPSNPVQADLLHVEFIAREPEDVILTDVGDLE